MKFLTLFFIFIELIFPTSLRILTEDFEPISYIDTNGNLGGYGVEVVEEIQKLLGKDDKIQLLPWARAYNIALGEKDVLLFATTYTDERNKSFTFVGPLISGKIRLYSNIESDDSIEKIKNHSTISVYRDSQEHQILKNQYFKNFEISTTPLSAAQKLIYNRADFWANVDLTTESILSHTSEDSSFYIHDYYIPIKLYLAFSAQTDYDLIVLWYEALKKLKDNGSLERIFKNYFPHLEFEEEIEIIKRR